jgi:hypothetical protein
MQRRLLEREKIGVAGNGDIDMPRFQWKKTARPLQKRNQPRMFG